MLANEKYRWARSALGLFADLADDASIIVFGFRGGEVLPIGPYSLRDASQRAAFRQRAAGLMPVNDADTPTAAAIDAVYDYLDRTGALPGAGCIVISDGKPELPGKKEGTPEEQFKRIFGALPRFAERGWRLHTVAIGRGGHAQYLPDFNRIAAQLGGVPLAANDPSELISVAVQAFTALRPSWPAPEVTRWRIGANGSVSVSLDIDATVKRLAVVLSRPSADVTSKLLDDRQRPVVAGDPRLRVISEDDEHYAAYALLSDSSLGEGRWTLRIEGPPATEVFVAISKRSSIALEIIEPRGGLLMAGRPGRVCAQFRDEQGPMGARGAAGEIRLSIKDAAAERTVGQSRLLDDGQREASGDSSRGDGIYCGMIRIAAGDYLLTATGATQGSPAVQAQHGLHAEPLPAFTMRKTPTTIDVRDGEVAEQRVAGVDWAGGKVTPDVVRELALVLTPQSAPEQERCGPRAGTLRRNCPATEGITWAIAFDANEDAYLVLRFPVTAADRGELGPGQVTNYKAVADAVWWVYGQPVIDQAALSTLISVRIHDWPWYCAPFRTSCTVVLPVLAALLAVLALGAGLAVRAVRREREQERRFARQE